MTTLQCSQEIMLSYSVTDPLFKIRPFLESLRRNMKNVEPEVCHSIDKQIIPFKGRSSLKQYNKNKPHKWDLKCSHEQEFLE